MCKINSVKMSCFCDCLTTCWREHKRMRLVGDLSSITEIDPDTEITGIETSVYIEDMTGTPLPVLTCDANCLIIVGNLLNTQT